jgi:hypothetical protein
MPPVGLNVAAGLAAPLVAVIRIGVVCGAASDSSLLVLFGINPDGSGISGRRPPALGLLGCNSGNIIPCPAFGLFGELDELEKEPEDDDSESAPFGFAPGRSPMGLATRGMRALQFCN